MMAMPPQTYHDFALIDMMESMRRSNVATYAIDPRGQVESKDLARECFPPPDLMDPCSSGFAWKSDVRLAQNGLSIMAEASGGFAVTNTDDFTSGIGRIVDDLDHYYLLGFYPADTKGRNYRPLDVKVPGHPEWKLRFATATCRAARHHRPRTPPRWWRCRRGCCRRGTCRCGWRRVHCRDPAPLSRVAFVLEVSVPRRALEEADGRLRDTLKYEVLVVNEKKGKVRSAGGLEARLTLSAAEQRGIAPDQAIYQVADVVDHRAGTVRAPRVGDERPAGEGRQRLSPGRGPRFPRPHRCRSAAWRSGTRRARDAGRTAIAGAGRSAGRAW